MRKVLLYLCAVLGIMAVGVFCSLSTEVYAYTLGSNSTMDKIVTKNTQSAVRIFKSNMTPLALKDNRDHLPFDNDGDSCTVPMPNTLISGSSNSSPKLNCYDFLVGNDKWSGVMAKPNLSGDNPKVYGDYLESVGYRKVSIDGINTKCLYALVSNPDITDASGNAYENQPTANRICSEVYDDTIGTLQLTDYPNNAKYQFRLDSSGNSYTTILYHDNDIITSVRDIVPGTTKWSSFVRSWENAATDWNNGRLRTTISSIKTTSSPVGSDDGDVTYGTSYEKTTTEAIMQAILGSSTVNTLSTAEVYNIYAQYLANTSYVQLSCGTSIDYANDGAYNWLPVKIKRDGEISNNCYVHEIGTMLYTGASSARRNGYYFTRENMTLSDIVDQINSFDLESIIDDIDDFNNPSSSLSDNGGSSNSEDDPCYNAGVEGMSWILCPALTNMTYTASAMDNVIEDWLTVNPDLYSSDSAAYTVWEIMRDVANGVMVVILLAIIFSQLTGYGIDNYGIKKMLPKLIVMAIVINLSFIVCDLAVDLSNILGIGLRNLFGAIGEKVVAESGGTQGFEGFITYVVGILLGAVSGGAVVSGVIIEAASVSGPMIIIVIVLALLVVLAAVLMFFVMLGARMVLVILCVALSPIAFALYILPNTQNIAKKWWKLFETALIMFPICGALGGIGYLVKSMVLVTDSWHLWMLLVSLMIPYLPFFLLPNLIRSSLAMLGTVGGALTAMTTGFRNNVQRGIESTKKSSRYKDAMEMGMERRAQGTFNRLQNTLRSGGTLTAGQRKRLLRSSALINKGRSEREKVFADTFALQPRSDVNAALAAALNGTDAERASAAFDTLIEQGGVDEALQTLSSQNWSTMDSSVRTRMEQKMASSNVDAMKSYAKYRQTGGQADFGDWASGSGAVIRSERASTTIKDKTFAQHLRDNGVHAMDAYGKDEMQFVHSNSGGLSAQLGADFDAMLGSAAIASKDAKAQTVTEGIISGRVGTGSPSLTDMGLTASSLGSMRDATALAIRDGYTADIMRRNPSLTRAQAQAHAERAIRAALATQIAAARADSRILNKMGAGVRAVLGI